VRARVAVGHGIGGQDDVISVLVGRTGSGLDADTRGDASQYDLGDVVLSEIRIERGLMEGTPALLGHQIVVGLDIQLVDEVRPV
jgi:hypothetical protein